MKKLKSAAVVAVATGGILIAGGGVAMAHGGANANGKAEHSPGVVSGNLVQAPVDVPVNVCGNTLNIVGLLTPAFGNECENR